MGKPESTEWETCLRLPSSWNVEATFIIKALETYVRDSHKFQFRINNLILAPVRQHFFTFSSFLSFFVDWSANKWNGYQISLRPWAFAHRNSEWPVKSRKQNVWGAITGLRRLARWNGGVCSRSNIFEIRNWQKLRRLQFPCGDKENSQQNVNNEAAHEDDKPSEITPTDERFYAERSDEIAQSVLALSQRLTQNILGESKRKFEIVSPISIASALQLAFLGSNGKTFNELMDLFVFDFPITSSFNVIWYFSGWTSAQTTPVKLICSTSGSDLCSKIWSATRQIHLALARKFHGDKRPPKSTWGGRWSIKAVIQMMQSTS